MNRDMVRAGASDLPLTKRIAQRHRVAHARAYRTNVACSVLAIRHFGLLPRRH